MELFTIGHSNLTIEQFINLLQKHSITAVADVRSHPYSRYLSHFNKDELKNVLINGKIQYVFLGKELGARPTDLSCYDRTGKALYDRIAQTELFGLGIQRLLNGAKSYKIALMCAEKDPLTCHRTILICQHLRQFNLNIYHILADGSLESQADLEQRLLDKFNQKKSKEKNTHSGQLSLFETSHVPLDQTIDLATAYQRQSQDIAYTKKDNETNED